MLLAVAQDSNERTFAGSPPPSVVVRAEADTPVWSTISWGRDGHGAGAGVEGRGQGAVDESGSMTTVDGLPAHILLGHLVVVLIPVTAL